VVAHSVSGIFLPLLPAHCPVSRMVFLAAFVPEIGKSPTQQLQANPEMFWPDWIGKDPTKDDAVAVHYLFHDCDPATAAWALTTRRLMHARHALTETCHLRRWPDVPASYIFGEFWVTTTNVSQGFRKAHHRGDHEKAGLGVPKRCGTGGTSGQVVNVCLTVHSSLPVSRSRSFNPGRTSGAAGIQ